MHQERQKRLWARFNRYIRTAFWKHRHGYLLSLDSDKGTGHWRNLKVTSVHSLLILFWCPSHFLVEFVLRGLKWYLVFQVQVLLFCLNVTDCILALTNLLWIRIKVKCVICAHLGTPDSNTNNSSCQTGFLNSYLTIKPIVQSRIHTIGWSSVAQVNIF